uniref:AP2/ERF domain-containing protein n=1 Tax=Lotus japonicus TaxID=34305 RepID=I3S908_LOTJA|nr:unknown [Lotus japonicus]
MVKSEHNKIKTGQKSKPVSSSLSSSSSASSESMKKKYKGVRMRTWGSFVSEIRAPNQKTRIWLGSYSTPEAAARAYDAALLCLKGSSASFNFPSSSSLFIPQDTAMSPKSIQRVAAAAANSFIDNNASTTTSTPPPPPSTSSSLVSSPPMDDVSLESSFESMAMMEPWYSLDDLQSTKYVDQMLSASSFYDIDSTHHLFNDVYEESDIRLWNFC